MLSYHIRITLFDPLKVELLTNVCQKQDLGPTTSQPTPQIMANQATSHSPMAQGTRKRPSFIKKNIGLSNKDPHKSTPIPCNLGLFLDKINYWDSFSTQKMGGKINMSRILKIFGMKAGRSWSRFEAKIKREQHSGFQRGPPP